MKAADLIAQSEDPAITAALQGRPPSFQHCKAMFGPFGMIQFANGPIPDPASGQCLDDNARALIAAVSALRLDPRNDTADAVGKAAMDFVVRSQLPDGTFHNLMDQRGVFTDDVGSEDSIGRAIWACALAARCAPDERYRATAADVLERSIPVADSLSQLKPRSYAIIALSILVGPPEAISVPPWVESVPRTIRVEAEGRLPALCAALDRDLTRNAAADWQWWEPELNWGNGRPPEALLRGALASGEYGFAQSGLRALRFLAGVTQPDGIFIPIGNDGWYTRGGKRPLYDQQPIEVSCMVDAWLAAAAAARDDSYRAKAVDAFAWFFGANTETATIADAATGGCHDGLMRGAINRNMGAESTLSYLQAHLSIAHAFLNP